MSQKRVGLLGGVFNPPHLGHLKLAELALGELGLDELWFVPAAQPPHKALPPGSPDGAARLRLLREAVEGLEGPFGIETLELERGGTCYSVDTLEFMAQRDPGTAWILVLGSDQLAQFTTWKRWDRILELGSLAVAHRPGSPAGVPKGLENRLKTTWSGAPGELVWLPSTELELSSSGLRVGLAAGEKIEGLPIQVRAAIGRENLYR